MAKNKTQATDASVQAYVQAIDDPSRRVDCEALLAAMTEASGAPARLWGTGMVGFGHYRYTYESGRSGEWFEVGFASRKNDLTIYLVGQGPQQAALLQALGPHKMGKSCLYLKRLADVDAKVLQALLKDSCTAVRLQYPG
jgi:hypothetical protein